MDPLEKELRSLYEAIIAKEKIELHLKNIDRLILEKEAELKKTEIQMAIEEDQVKRLERKSLYAIFQYILGNKSQQIEKERQEYLQAYLKYQSIVSAMANLKKEKALLLQNYSSKFNTERAFDDLIKNKIKAIRKAFPKGADYIVHFEERIARHQSKIKEITQAIREGKKTIRKFKVILINLDKINNWGSFNSRKQRNRSLRIKDKIIRDINLADNHLQKFEKELLDVSDHFNMDYSRQIESTKDFLDYFYDGLIADWVIQGKIENSVNIIQHFSDKILRIISMLQQESDQTKTYIKAEKRDQRKLLMNVLDEK
ncbi:MAG: hypothetical protein AAF985_17080 [Bacteroidota bacterium]